MPETEEIVETIDIDDVIIPSNVESVDMLAALELNNELLMYTSAGIWFLIALTLIMLFFVAKGVGNNS